jgi:Tol biopolymer transport system component
MRRLMLIVASCMCVAVVGLPGNADADVFGPIQLASARNLRLEGGTFFEQAESAKQPALSSNGRYLAFVGSFGGVSGIWRRDLETGEVEQVAPGAAYLPSISETGQYVSFTTAARLDPDEDHNRAPDVYVRDMATPCEAERGSCLPCPENSEGEQTTCPFTVVSAVNGSREGATYTYAKSEEESAYGSFASGRSAIDAKGNFVAFETAAESNLLGEPTPAREILLRDLETDETRLVSSEYDPQTGTDTGVPVPLVEAGGTDVGAAYRVGALGSEFGGASISADGSTVAWLGQDISRQAKLLPGEQTTYPAEIDEPLWRRVQEGPSTPTRRVTGGSEPENPLCVASGESEVPAVPNTADPCRGPFALFEHLRLDYILDASNKVNFVPQLSGDGDAVAFLASAREVGTGEEISGSDEDDDLYVAQMEDGLTRIQAQRRLTEIAGEVGNPAFSGQIVDVGISPDGSQVAFTTERTEFPLGAISYVSPIAPEAGVAELFDADLADDTLTRVTHGYLGEAVPSKQNEGAGEGAASPSFSGDGNKLSFASSADDLVYGDGNGASDVFLVDRDVFTNVLSQQTVSSPPAAPVTAPEWRLFVTATSEPSGAVALDVSVPGSGELNANASAPVRVQVRTKRAMKKHTVLLTHTVASTRTGVPPSTDGIEKLTLTLTAPYRELAQRSGGLYTTITVKFTAPGRPVLSTKVAVSFRRTIRPPRTSRAARGRKGAHR